MKVLIVGTALAALGGIWLGGATEPQLRDRAQTAPSTQVRSDMSGQWTSDAYPSGRVPDYVLGTDWTAPKTSDYADASYQDEPLPEADYEPIDYAAYEAPPAAPEPLRPPEPQPAPIALPSLGGGVVAAPQAPQAEEAPVAPEAPPAPELG